MGELLTRASWQVGENKAYISSKLRLRWWLSCVSSFVEGVGWSWFDTARRRVDMDWYLYNTGRDIRLINGCGPTPESVRGSKGRNAQRRGFLSEDSCRSSERVPATTNTYFPLLINLEEVLMSRVWLNISLHHVESNTYKLHIYIKVPLQLNHAMDLINQKIVCICKVHCIY